MSAEALERRTSAPADRRIVPARTPRLFWRNRAIDLALASPLLLAVMLLNPYTLSTGTINQQLVAQILAGGDGGGPTQPAGLILRVLATLLPHDRAHVILAVLGCLLAGRLLHYLLAALWRESVAGSVTAACILTLAVSPLFAFVALTNFPLILAMTLFAMSVVGAMRMAMWNDTRAGFNAGATLLLAVLSHPLALVCAAVLAVSMPFLPHARRDQDGVHRANITVMLFPVLAATLMWVVFEVLFLGLGETWTLYTSFLQGAGERASWLVSAAQQPAGLVIFGPFLAGLLLWPVLRHGGVPLGSGLVLVIVLGSYLLGVISLADTGSTFMVTMIIGIVFFPRPRSAWSKAGMVVVMMLLLAATWWGSWHHEVMNEWLSSASSL